MTPLHIELLLHCHCCADHFPRLGAPAVDSYLLELEAEKLITKPDGGIYTTTQRGAAHVKQLCDLALPTLRWTSADGKLLAEAS